jgi:hypothetical protein
LNADFQRILKYFSKIFLTVLFPLYCPNTGEPTASCGIFMAFLPIIYAAKRSFRGLRTLTFNAAFLKVIVAEKDSL